VIADQDALDYESALNMFLSRSAIYDRPSFTTEEHHDHNFAGLVLELLLSSRCKRLRYYLGKALASEAAPLPSRTVASLLTV
jgi:hypothetical protein